MVTRIREGAPPHDVWVECNTCDARWLGQPFDQCEWCQADAKANGSYAQRLLFPEWMGWGDRFARLSAIDQRVWATTRGIHGNYEVEWLRRVRTAAVNQVITGQQLTQALNRYHKWKTQMKPSSGN